MNRFSRGIALLTLLFSSSIFAANLAIKDMVLNGAENWQLKQSALDEGTAILGFAKGTEYLTVFVKSAQSQEMKSVFANEAQVLSDVESEKLGEFNWHTMETAKTPPELTHLSTFYVAAFQTAYRGNLYYGYSHSLSRETAHATVLAFLKALTSHTNNRSLTGPDYTGKKYYLGFGDELSGEMGNEVKYDVSHTHDIFTKPNGGNYIGEKMIGEDMGDQLKAKWQELGAKMTTNDMYIQYSSGHGSHTGLLFGPSYNEIRDNALSYPAKEIIIFTMSCYSGNLVTAFDDQKSVWGDWQSKGRTLFVMSSSGPSETSSTGPGTDPEEPNGPEGSAGSAFGHSLWKALIGHADGYIDGVKKGYLTLADIREFTKATTQTVGGHTPTVTGAYNDNLIMNKVPSQAFLDSLKGGTEGLSDAEIMNQIQALDRANRVY